MKIVSIDGLQGYVLDFHSALLSSDRVQCASSVCRRVGVSNVDGPWMLETNALNLYAEP